MQQHEAQADGKILSAHHDPTDRGEGVPECRKKGGRPDCGLGNTALFILADELRPVDNLCDRWAKQAFDWPARRSNPIYRLIKQAEGAALPTGPDPMDDDVAILDKVI